MAVVAHEEFDLVANACGHRRIAGAMASGDRALAILVTPNLGGFQHAGYVLFAKARESGN